jgi:hypothetical protein
VNEDLSFNTKPSVTSVYSRVRQGSDVIDDEEAMPNAPHQSIIGGGCLMEQNCRRLEFWQKEQLGGPLADIVHGGDSAQTTVRSLGS